MMEDQQIKTLMLACELEQSIAELYGCFAERCPELKDLWVTLIQEEREHAEAIRGLYRQTYEGKSRFDAGAIKGEAIQSVIDFVKETTAAARRGPFPAVRAASIACDLEKSLVEKDIFAHFRVTPAYAEVLQTLQRGTRRHIQLTRDALERLKAGEGRSSP